MVTPPAQAGQFDAEALWRELKSQGFTHVLDSPYVVIDTIRGVFERFGFEPLQTPAIHPVAPAFADRLPMDANDFLWASDSPVNRDAEGRARRHDRAIRWHGGLSA